MHYALSLYISFRLFRCVMQPLVIPATIFALSPLLIIIIIIKDIYIAQVCKGHKCAMSTEMAVWLHNCLCLYS